MLHKSSTQLAFLSVLLLVLGFYVIFAEQEEVVGLEVLKGTPHYKVGHWGNGPWVRVETNERFVHNNNVYELDELVQHLTYDYYEWPFQILKIIAEENIKHDILVRFSVAMKQKLPDTVFVWESYRELASR